MKPSPVLPALLAGLLFLSIGLAVAWTLLPRLAGLYRAIDLATRAALLAGAGILLLESLRGRGAARLVAAGGASLAAGSLLLGVPALTFLLAHGLSALWAYGVPAAVGAILVSVARRRAVEGG